jgi:DNA polymerase (family X)
MSFNKKDVIKLLETIAVYMELKGENPFKVAAFRKAAGALETDDRTLAAIEDFTALNGIGKGTAAVIDEYISTGTSTVLEELQEEVPKGLIPLLQLQGLGGKKIAKLHKELHVKDIDDLKLACEEGKVRDLVGFGKKTEEKILASIQEAGSRPDRLPLAFMLPIADDIEAALANMDYILRFSRAGSIRRMRETIKDLDFIISTEYPEKVKDQLLALSGVKQVIAAGDTKVSVTLGFEYDVSVDFRIVEDREFITTLHHFTGSKDHNVRMRQLAKDKGEKISEYGVEVIETGEILTFEKEEDFFSHFGLPYIPPEAREDGTEVEQFNNHDELISFEDIKGDLHMHSTWSDGAHSIEEIIEACISKGYKYMAITDHSKYLRVANGLTVERLREQKDIIRTLNEKYKEITILSGIEMDILPDGTLDYDDELLAELDLVIASIHSSFSQPQDVIMDRLKTALQNPHVDIIAHPTGRVIGRRKGYDVNLDQLIELAKETGTALELNGNPHRLDLASPYLKKAQEAGVTIVINTDAHSIDMLEDMEIGVSYAKKGWVKQTTVLNARGINGLMDFLKRND